MDTSGCTGITEHDLVSYGVLGLVKAAERYNKGRRVRFKTYAEHLVVGAMRDGVRQWRIVHHRHQGGIRVASLERDCAAEAMAVMEGREALEVQRAIAIVEGRQWLDAALCALEGVELEVISAHFRDGEPFRRIAQRLGITIKKLITIRDRALRRLREWTITDGLGR